MQQIINITSQNQISIPAKMLRSFGTPLPRKALVIKEGGELRVRPLRDFDSIFGSLKSKVKLTDQQLRQARKAFGENWGRKQ